MMIMTYIVRVLFLLSQNCRSYSHHGYFLTCQRPPVPKRFPTNPPPTPKALPFPNTLHSLPTSHPSLSPFFPPSLPPSPPSNLPIRPNKHLSPPLHPLIELLIRSLYRPILERNLMADDPAGVRGARDDHVAQLAVVRFHIALACCYVEALLGVLIRVGGRSGG